MVNKIIIKNQIPIIKMNKISKFLQIFKIIKKFKAYNITSRIIYSNIFFILIIQLILIFLYIFFFMIEQVRMKEFF